MDELIRPSNATLGQMPEGVLVPQYDRAGLTHGIVHIGLGNFHRAHQAWYLHRLMQAGKAQDWGIVGAGVRPFDSAMREKLAAQDYVYTLIELDPEGTSAEVVGSLIDYAPIEPGNGPLIARMADPATRIVSMTVTEAGYFLNSATKRFDPEHPDIVHDTENPGQPRTLFGAMVEALRLRRERGLTPFTGQSCDNLAGNGRLLKEVVLSLARLTDPGLADWIEEHGSFPNAMVDCIVPATGPREIALARDFGIDDAAPVTHERFRQWVLEDDFCAGRPPWEEVGATFTNRVHDYETMKLRILNGGHQMVAVPGEILGIRTIADSMAHPLIHAFFRRVALEEVAPNIRPVPDMTPQAYVDLIDARFSNQMVVDTVRRVAMDGSAKLAGQVFLPLSDGLAAGTPVEGLALAQALWSRMCAGTREDGSTIEPNDPRWAELQAASQAARARPRAWLEQPRLYGELADQPRFADAFERWLPLVWAEGSEAALERYLAA
ncbi:mannitol dehydrogenase family protein [Oceanibium sediminis]|uniref:mannitol dehydrogenase family protein n=1 Tax=Oceanibium sediminis TaxID=2026339 RepID=UPI000DD3D642|nr:mannitol dehydrogenase family protein [Oceanibium sediminis]